MVLGTFCTGVYIHVLNILLCTSFRKILSYTLSLPLSLIPFAHCTHTAAAVRKCAIFPYSNENGKIFGAENALGLFSIETKRRTQHNNIQTTKYPFVPLFRNIYSAP